MPLGSLRRRRTTSRATSARSTALSVPATMNLPSLEHDVVLAGLHQVGGDLLALGDDLVGRGEDARCRRTTVEREPNVPVPIATWSVSPYLKRMRLGRDAELVGDDLAERGLVALAVVVRADRDGQRAGRIEADLGVLDQAGVRGLDRVGDADAAQLAALARLARGAPQSRRSRPCARQSSRFLPKSPQS